MKIFKDKDLVSEIEKDVPVLVFFHMNGCGHCDVFKPIWKEIASEIKKTDNIKLGQIELDKIKLLPSNLQKVYGFPSIQIIKNNKKIAEYDGNRVKNDVIKFAKRFSTNKEKIEGGKKAVATKSKSKK